MAASASTNWTNKSVKGFGAGSNPIDVIVAKARTVVLEAMADGWTGPPFDPVDLAGRLGIEVELRDDIADARTVASAGGKLRIEFNPNRPRGRTRYSVAHEIAHTFFPDCREKVRHRADKDEVEGDDWQLEMLCNIAAAELVMPIGSFPDLRERAVSIDALMKLRNEYDVSIEALLLRFIRLTRSSCALFASTRAEGGGYEGRYRIDYAVASQAWTRCIPLGQYLNDDSRISECTAIGFTAKGSQVFPDGSRFHLECVGTPPYPGHVYPRVLGLLTDPDDQTRQAPSITYLTGDALQPRGTGPKIIAHIMNDRSATWGGGFAKKLALKFTDAQVDYRVWCDTPANRALGNTHFFGVPSHIEVATMIAQQGIGRSTAPSIRYPALQHCLASIRARAKLHQASVHMPRIGCGIAGGKWEVVGELVERELIQHGVHVTVYDLPNRG